MPKRRHRFALFPRLRAAGAQPEQDGPRLGGYDAAHALPALRGPLLGRRDVGQRFSQAAHRKPMLWSFAKRRLPAAFLPGAQRLFD